MKKLYIFSYGLYPGQITLETLAAMRQCGAVYTHCLDKATAGQFSKLAPGLKLNAGLNREETARAAVSALAGHDTVGFLTYGNPLFLNQTAAEVMKAAAGKKAAVTVFAGVSSFDALVNLFNLNKYSPRGLRLVDAAASVDRPFFTPDMDTLIFVPDVLNLPENAARKKDFVAAALEAYPPTARVFLADCASISGRSVKVVKGKISGLGALLEKINERHTIFIPAVRKRFSGGERERASGL
ncbi:MAG: SAM-dependent methyltransferase [Elusimicrobiota bacterium]|nr:SAM-dependent methyltransferase [Elusimicrobiota bacterium]